MCGFLQDVQSVMDDREGGFQPSTSLVGNLQGEFTGVWVASVRGVYFRQKSFFGWCDENVPQGLRHI